MATQQKRKAWRLVYPEHVAYLTGPFPWPVWINAITSPFVGYFMYMGAANHLDSGWWMFFAAIAGLFWMLVSWVNAIGMVLTRAAFRNVPGYRARKIQEAEDAAANEAWLKAGGDQDRIDAILKRTPNP